MIFVDSNIPMYIIGAAHAQKTAAIAILEDLFSSQQALVTDAEVFQEILHRYTAIQRREAIQPAFDVLMQMVDQIYAVDFKCVQLAKDLVLQYTSLSARDALHLAVMKSHQVTSILSFDNGFDNVPNIKRYGT